MTDTEKAALERRIDELCQENERLRNQLHDQQDTAEHNFVRNAREYKRVCDENDKLRELVDGIEFCSTTGSRSDDCIGCPLLDQSTHNYRCTKTECMTDLGIEVPE